MASVRLGGHAEHADNDDGFLDGEEWVPLS
jgi:hypothetical protein